LILPPRPPGGRGFGPRVLHSFPDLALAALFVAAWLDLGGLSERYGVGLLLLIEIEGWILIVSLLTVGLAYGLATDEEWKERAKSLIGLLALCAIPPVYFALRWHVWWPIGAYAGLLWNRLRLARAGADGARRMRAPLRELLYYGGAAALSMWLTLPPLGTAEVHFRIADYPGWCHAPQAVIPDDLLSDVRVVTWCAAPYRALAAGAAYYALTGVATLLRGPYRLSLMWGWVRRDPDQ